MHWNPRRKSSTTNFKKKIKNVTIQRFCDSDYTGDQDTRKGVAGFGHGTKTTCRKKCVGMMVYCNNDYAGDKDGRKSGNGFVIYILGCLVSGKSRSQKLVTLSSTEAEYYSI